MNKIITVKIEEELSNYIEGLQYELMILYRGLDLYGDHTMSFFYVYSVFIHGFYLPS